MEYVPARVTDAQFTVTVSTPGLSESQRVLIAADADEHVLTGCTSV